MIKTEIVPDTAIVTATIDGGYTAEDIEAFRERVQALATAGEAKPSVLLTFGDLDAGNITPAGAWEDLKSAKILDEVDKIAIVTDGGGIDKAAGVADKVTPLTIEVFTPDQRDHAMAWLTS